MVVLNDVLCFVSNKFGKVVVKTLKSTLSDFYSGEVLSSAKLQLLNDVDKLNLSTKRPHVSHRRDMDGKADREVDDIVTLFTFLDENKAIGLLPKYVAGSPDNMPSFRLYEGDLNIVMNMLRDLYDKVSGHSSVLAAICRDVSSLQVSCKPPASSAAIVSTTPLDVAQTRRESYTISHRENPTVQLQSAETETVVVGASGNSAASRYVDGGGSSDWATLSSTPYQCSNRFAVLSTDDDDQRDQSGDEQPYTTVSRRTVKRSRQRTPPSASQSQPQQRQQQQQQQPRQRQQQQRQRSTTDQSNRQRRAPTVFGTSSSVRRSNITAAKKLYKKAIFCIDNVSTSCTVKDISAFVSDLAVDVLSCFEVKPRRRRHETSVSDRTAFRLCINDNHRDRLLNATAWPEFITISEWYFKPRDSDEENKRRRLDDGRPEIDDERSLIGGISAGDVAAAAAIAVAVSSESTAAVAVDEADRTVEMSDDTIVMADYNTQDGN